MINEKRIQAEYCQIFKKLKGLLKFFKKVKCLLTNFDPLWVPEILGGCGEGG